MKKIKYLLFWIVWLLWIGFSFSDSNIDFYIDYFTNNWWLTSYNLSTRSSYSFCSLWINSYSYSTNIDDYFSWCPSSFFNNWFGVYFNDNWNKLTYYLPWKTLSWWQYGSVLVISNNLADSSVWDISNGAYSRVLWNENCLWTGVFQTWNFCDSYFIELFTNKYYTISSLWNIYDSDYDWVHYYKWPVAPSVWLWYSFWFVTWSWWQKSWDDYYLDVNNWDFFNFRTITFSGSTIFPIDWPLIFRLNNTTNLSVWDSYKIIALGPTWDYQDFSFIYSIYNCSSSATTIFDCLFLEGWDISENFSYSFNSYNRNPSNINLIYFLTSFWPVKFNNSYSSTNNTLSLSSLNGWSLNSNSITLNLVPSATWIDIIDNIEDNSWWGWNQTTNPVSSLYYSCLGPTYNTPDWRPPVYCFDSSWNFNADRLRNCFTDYIATWWELQWGLFCNIDWFIQSVVFTWDWSWVSIVPCTSDSCYSPLIIWQSYINLDSVNNVTTWLVLDMITNLTWRVGRCPFPYVDFWFWSTFKVFSYLKSLWYSIDPFFPINCAVAWFHAGRYTIFEDLNLTIFNTPILNWDTKNYKILFRFFDVLIIFAIFWIFRFFRKHI